MAQNQETKIQNDIRVELSKAGIVVRNNVGRFYTTTGYPIAVGVPGMADLTLFAEGGKTIFVEVKTPTGKLSDQQKRFKKAVERLGFEYIVMRSKEEATALCEHLKKSNS